MKILRGSDCVRVVVEEILKGKIVGLGEPLSYSGIAIVPIVRFEARRIIRRQVSSLVPSSVQDAIIGSLPENTCGVFVLDSLGDVIAFKLHLDVNTFWTKIGFVKKLIADEYKDTRKPLSKLSVSTKAVAFLLRLKLKGPEGIMHSESDYFAISRLDSDCRESIDDLFATTASVLYCAAS